MQFNPFPIACSPYGASGTRKSSQIAEYIKLNYKTTGKKARLLNCDDGGLAAYRALIAAKIVELVDISQHPYNRAAPQTWLIKIAKGLWPHTSAPGGKIGLQDMQEDPNFDTLVIEGLDSGAAKIGGHYVAGAVKVNQDVVALIVDDAIDGSKVQTGSMSMAHYGAVQNIITNQFLPFIWSLKYDNIFVTTHEAVGDDKTGLDGKVYGPGIIGKALVSKTAQQIPVLLHFDSVASKPKAGPDGKAPSSLVAAVECRAYFTAHQDLGNPTAKAIWPANSRIPQSQWASLFKKYPDGYLNLDDPAALYNFFQFWRSLCQKDLDELTALTAPSSSEAAVNPTTPPTK